MIQILEKGMTELGMKDKITLKQMEGLMTYKTILLEWNERINLTAITEEAEIAVKHFLDSLTVLSFMEKGRDQSLVDVGTGAGFPGIPVKLMRPETSMVLLDALNKRVNFLDDVIGRLDLHGIQAMHLRAEEGAHKPELRERFDLCTARAVTELPVLAEYCLGYVKPGGRFLAMKGPDVEEELQRAGRAIKVMGGEVEAVKTFRLPYGDILHTVVSIGKVSETPPGFPRKQKQIARSPIH